MQAFDLDWARMIDLAAVWATLPYSARRALLEKRVQVSPSTAASRLGPDAQPLIDAGIAVRMVLNPAHLHLNAPYQSPLPRCAR